MINVNELTDVELNRAMIWLYPQKGITAVFNYEQPTYYNAGTGVVYGWLSDWNLTMSLAVENKIALLPCITGRHLATRYVGTENVEAANKNPLRAICEVLVQIKLEQKQ